MATRVDSLHFLIILFHIFCDLEISLHLEEYFIHSHFYLYSTSHVSNYLSFLSFSLVLHCHGWSCSLYSSTADVTSFLHSLLDRQVNSKSYQWRISTMLVWRLVSCSLSFMSHTKISIIMFQGGELTSSCEVEGKEKLG